MITSSEFQSLNTINLVGGLFSFFGATLIIGCYIAFRDLRSVAFKLVLFLSISDLCYAITGFLNSDAYEQCIAQAVLTQLFSLSSIAWTTSIAFTLKRAILDKVHPDSLGANLPRYQLVCWGVPIFLTILPTFSKSYGYSNGWCWLVDDSFGNAWKFCSFYLPLWISILYLIIVYYRIYQSLDRSRQQARTTSTEAVTATADEEGSSGAVNEAAERAREADAARAKIMSRIKWYPALLIVCYTFATINRIYNIFGSPLFSLTVLHFVGIRFRGFFNSILYGFNPAVQSALTNSCRRT